MPITQARMLTLIDAAQDYMEAYRVLHLAVTDFLNSGDTDTLARIALNASFIPSHTSGATIASERVHFKHRERVNNRNAARMRFNRGSTSPSDRTIGETTKHRAKHRKHAGYIPSQATPFQEFSTAQALERNAILAIDPDTDYSTPLPGVPSLAELRAERASATGQGSGEGSTSHVTTPASPSPAPPSPSLKPDPADSIGTDDDLEWKE